MASQVEMPSGRRQKDYAAETTAQALEIQAQGMGIDPADWGDDEAVAEAPMAQPDQIASEPVAA